MRARKTGCRAPCEPGDCTLSLHLANEDGAGRSASGTHGVSGAPGLSDRVMIVCCRTWKLLKDYGCGPREEACAVCCVHLHAADAFVVELCRALQPRLAAQACSERGGPVATIHCTTAKLCFGQATSWLQYRACSIYLIYHADIATGHSSHALKNNVYTINTRMCICHTVYTHMHTGE